MKQFIRDIFVFSSIIGLAFIIGFVLPATPRATKSLLFAKLDKDKILKKNQENRLILIGGSNVSFGFKSEIFKDSLNLNPVNTGIHASIGLVYMLETGFEHIKKGDIVVVSPEYSQFYGDFAYGGNELLRTVLDVDYSPLNLQQWINVSRLIPAYSFSKLKPSEYYKPEVGKVYSVNAFNSYGDACAHWELESRGFQSISKFTGGYNPTIVEKLKAFEAKIESRGALLYITFPPYEETSFEISKSEIDIIYKDLKRNDFKLLGTPNRYKTIRSLHFDTPYHLTEEGATWRTLRLIEDLEQIL